MVKGYEELMMISAGGMVVRTAIETISERTGRLTSGVKLMNVRDGDRLAAIAILEPSNGNGNGDEGAVVEEDGTVIDALPARTPSAAPHARRNGPHARRNGTDAGGPSGQDVESPTLLSQ